MTELHNVICAEYLIPDGNGYDYDVECTCGYVSMGNDTNKKVAMAKAAAFHMRHLSEAWALSDKEVRRRIDKAAAKCDTRWWFE